jgi:hypothetical protein
MGSCKLPNENDGRRGGYGRDGGGQAEEELKNRIRKMGSFHKIK